MPTLFLNLLLALAIGLLIGTERGWKAREADEGTRVAGVRTFGLLGLLGGVWGMLAWQLGETMLGFAFVALAGVLIATRFLSHRDARDVGITTLIAALLTFSLGALAVRGWQLEAAGLAVVVTILLSMKPVMHRWLRRLTAEELSAFLKLLLILVVLLPVLPDRGYGPWQVLNPWQLGWLVALIAGISFGGYVAMKIVGVERGVLLAALLGGMVSSTVTTMNLARLQAKLRLRALLIAGILLSSAVMFPRILIEVLVVNNQLLEVLIPPFAVITLLLLAAAWYFWRHQPRRHVLADLPVSRPLELSTAIKFTLLLVAIIVLAEALRRWYGDIGVYVLSLVSGLMDVDAITLSLAHLSSVSPASAPGSAAGLAPNTAVAGIMLAAATNSLVKGGLALILGGRALGIRVMAAMCVALTAGGLVLFLDL